MKSDDGDTCHRRQPRLHSRSLANDPDASRCRARRLVEAWRIDYNVERPHTALGGLAPVVYAEQVSNQRSGSLELRKGSARRTSSPHPKPEGKANRLY